MKNKFGLSDNCYQMLSFCLFGSGKEEEEEAREEGEQNEALSCLDELLMDVLLHGRVFIYLVDT